MTFDALPYVLLQGIFFGTTLVASRFSVGQFHPTLYIGLRLLLASAAHLLIYALSPQRQFPTGALIWRRATVLGLLGTAVPMTAIVSSLQYQSSGVTSVLITAGPALTVLLAHFTLPDEKLSTRKGLGVALALGGALLLAILGETGLPDLRGASPPGYGLVFAAMLAGAASNIYARRQMRELDLFDVASIRMFVAALAVLPLSLLLFGFRVENVDLRGVAALGYATVAGTVLGHLLGFLVIQRYGATPAALTGYVIPVVATVTGAVVLGETVTAGMLAGMALIILGISLLNRRREAPALAAPGAGDPSQVG